MLVIKNLCKVKNIFLKIETNIRQRGIGNPNAIKLGRCIKELERIYGIQNGNNQHDRVPKLSEGSVYSQKQLADMIGISVDTLNNYKMLNINSTLRFQKMKQEKIFQKLKE